MIAEQTGPVVTGAAAGWIQTWTGRRFSFAHPVPDDIDVRDIARGLSMQCRFNGHCRQFYSVAEHCVRASLMVPGWCRREALLHDAAEAYTGDCVRPLKLLLGDAFQAVEERIERAIAERYGVRFPWPSPVKVADDLLLTVEARDLMGGQGELSRHVGPPVGSAAGDLQIVTTMTASEAERAFLRRFAELFDQEAVGVD